MKELWRTIEGYEGLYEVSNMGNVRSLDRIEEFVRWENNYQKQKGQGFNSD